MQRVAQDMSIILTESVGAETEGKKTFVQEISPEAWVYEIAERIRRG